LEINKERKRGDDRGGKDGDQKERLKGCGKGKRGRSWRRRCFMEEEREGDD
jgi:hypothetical protein